MPSRMNGKILKMTQKDRDGCVKEYLCHVIAASAFFVKQGRQMAFITTF